MKSNIGLLALLAGLSSVGWAQDGATIYKTKCAVCHGADGQGKPKAGSQLVGISMSQEQITALLIKGGGKKSPHTKPMNAMQDAQAKAVADFVKKLK